MWALANLTNSSLRYAPNFRTRHHLPREIVLKHLLYVRSQHKSVKKAESLNLWRSVSQCASRNRD